MMESDGMLIVPEVAERLLASADTVRRWVREGKLRAVFLGGIRLEYRISESELTRFVAARVASGSAGWDLLDRWVHGSMAGSDGSVPVLVVGVHQENGKVRYRRLPSTSTADRGERDLMLAPEEEGPFGAFTALPGQDWS